MKRGLLLMFTLCSAMLSGTTPEEQVKDILKKNPPANWQESGISKEYYLDLMERIVRRAAPWVDAKGAVIDPVIHQEWGQTSSRFASSCAILIYFGRCSDLREKLYTVMDYCCEGLHQPDSVKRSSDFWMRELATAWHVLAGIAPDERHEKWRKALASVVPQKNYKQVRQTPEERKKLHNWAVYASAGESMRESYGISGRAGELWGNAFFDAYMEHQFQYFNSFGMYRDPNDPFTYDITTRLQIEAALEAGYKGKYAAKLRKLLDRAMFPTLLFVAPSGEVPFGGRSSQFHYQEGIVSALCELAAKRYKTCDPRLASAFKRQAHLSALAVKESILRDDGRLFHLKNCFPPESRHGCDIYGHYSVYSLFASSVFGLAALYADDSIKESPAPSETGGFSFALTGSFEKGFLNYAGNYAEFDLKSLNCYDGAGLGRVLLAGVPWGILPVMPCAKEPSFCISPEFEKPGIGASIAPEWTGENGTLCRLAEFEGDAALFKELAPGICQAVYQAGAVQILYKLDLSKKGVMTLEVGLKGKFRDPVMVIPVLESDGLHHPEVQFKGSGFQIPGILECISGGGTAREEGYALNRTGKYRLVKIPFNGNSITLQVTCLK